MGTRTRWSRWTLVLLVMLLALVPGTAAAETTISITYQGMLSDAADNPVDGSVQMTFAIYQAQEGGTPLWSETQTVAVGNGLFQVQLGSVTPLLVSIFDGSTRYLGITVGSDPEMTPRQAIWAGPPGPTGPPGANWP